jgi:predicted nucleic acid-binding protein
LPLLRTSQLGFKFYDALHLAFAEAGGADIFLTTDDRLLRKAQQYRDSINVMVENPSLLAMGVSKEDGNEIS